MSVPLRQAAISRANTVPVAISTASRDVGAAVEENGRTLLRFFLRRVDNPEDAADLLGETLLTAWKRAGSMPKGETSARMWLFGIANNVLLNHRRGRRRHLALADRLRLELATRADSVGRNGKTNDSEEELLQYVRGLITDLDPKERDLVALIHWEGFTVVEAARILGINPSTARTRYSRARARLQQALRESDDV